MKYSRSVNNYYNENSKRQNNLFIHYQNPKYKQAISEETRPRFPFVSSLEFTNRCNLDCLFCARAVMTRPLGFMSKKLFDKIINEYRQHKIFIKVNGYGENLLHPKVKYFIKEIKKKNGFYFTSNFTLVNDEIAKCFIENNVDVVQVSFQGLNKKSYEEQRRRSSYELVENNIKKLIKLRGSHPYPFIHLSTTILDEDDSSIEKFINYWLDEIGVDSVGIGFTDYERVIEEMIKDKKRKKEIDKMKKRQTLIKVPNHTYLYRYIDICWDGTVVSSFFDFNKFIPVGDLNKQSMLQIWNKSEVLNALRVLEKNKLLNTMKVFDTFYHAWNTAERASYNLNS